MIYIIVFSSLAVNGAAAAQKTILAFGDSLTAGYGISWADSFPAQLEKKLLAKGHAVKVINAGVSGDTTSGGLTRLEWTLAQKPDFAIVELGANDMLRAIDPAVTRRHLEEMLKIFQKNKIPVLLAGMKAMPNLGMAFVNKYEQIYPELAEKYGALYYPFFLEGVVAEKGLLLEDGLHPSPAGVAVIVDKIFPFVEELLERK